MSESFDVYPILTNAIIPMALTSPLLRIVGFTCCVLLAGCSGMPEQPVKVFKGPLVWPQPPDQPRFAYQTVLRAPADIAAAESAQDKFLREISGGQSTSNKPVFDKPAAIVARKGRIYIADTSTESIVVFDVPRRKVFRFGQRQPDVLLKPYVADAKRRQVMVFDSLGLFLRVIGEPADLERPTGVAVSLDGERIYVIDRSDNESNGHKVVIYGKDGAKIKVIGTRGNGEGQFNVPLQGAVAPDGTLYVLDSGNFRVQAFDRDGRFLRAFGSPGINPGNFARPRGIAVDTDGNIYVSDASFNNFQVFQPDGQLLMAVGQAGSESNPGQYGLLNGIAADETGHVYVADQLFNKVEVFRRLNEQEGQKMLQAAQN
jgi:DNA-binding beta-propeller fold protein YncE